MPTLVSVFGVQPFRIGGTETFARELSLQLGCLGWKSVLCFEAEPSEDVRRFLDLPNVAIRVVGDTSTFNLEAAKKLRRVFMEYSPDIVHLHYTGFLGVYGWLAKIASAKKIFFTDHSSRPAGYEPSRAPWWKRRAVRIINWPLTNVICVSGYGYRCLTGLDLLPMDRFRLVYNAVDLSRVQASQSNRDQFRERYAVPLNRIVVIQVSWMIPEKGIGDLLEAARLVIEEQSNVHFVLIGEGASRQEYMRLAESLGIESNVTWTGLVQDPFNEGVYDAADIVCQVSKWEELFGWMIAEAMAYSKPIVATRVGGIPELVADRESGYLIERGDRKAMADRILALVKQPELRSVMGRNGRERVEAQFDLQKNVSQLIQVYGLGSGSNSNPTEVQ
jgi:glycosyltransferase involved in cell wall biosynthesis